MSQLYVSDRRINRKKSVNPYAKMSYRQLQKVARTMNLPTNPRFKVLLALVIAKSTDRTDVLDLIQDYLKMNQKIVDEKGTVQNNDITVIICNSTGNNFNEILDINNNSNFDNSVNLMEILDDHSSKDFNMCEITQILGETI